MQTSGFRWPCAIAPPFAALLCVLPTATSAATLLGAAQPFAVLGASMVTNSGKTTIDGDIGVYPSTPITGTGTITQDGTIHDEDAVAEQAQASSLTAFNSLAALPSSTNLTGDDLGTVGVLTPGVYTFDSSAQLTGTLTLNFAGAPNQPFIFQIGAALTTDTASDIVVLNGGPNSDIYWEVGSSATLGAGTTFAGNILAGQSITLEMGASILCGRAIALNAAVTMDANMISDTCTNGGDLGSERSDFGSYGFSGGAVPEPSTWAMLILGLGAVGLALRRRVAALVVA